MGIRERLQEIADELGSQKALADAAGVSKGRVTQWLKDKDILPTSIAAETALNIEKNAGFRARWLVLNEGPRLVGKSQQAESTIPPHRLSRDGEQKLLVVLRSFLETDDEGKNQIVEAVKAVTGENGTGHPAKHHRSTKRRGGSSSH